MQKVLEAKLVLAPNLVLSIDTEFIENERENVEKQDCEVTATKRLLERLKKDFLRLPIVIQGDSCMRQNQSWHCAGRTVGIICSHIRRKTAGSG